MTRRHSRFLLAVVFVLAPAIARGAPIDRTPRRTYSTAEGLGHFVVNRIVRDSGGLLWVCTREGLSMFDGYGFTTLGVTDGLPSGNITDLIEAPGGGYWVGTIEGLAFFDPAALPGRRFAVIPSPGDSRIANVSQIVVDVDGTVWVGTLGGLYYVVGRGPTARLQRLDLGIPDQLGATMIHALLADRDGNMWIASGNGVFVRDRHGALTALAPREGQPWAFVGAMLQDRDGRIWMTTQAELWEVRLDAGKPRLVAAWGARDGLFSPGVLWSAPDGGLWVGTRSGLLRVDARSHPGAIRVATAMDAGGRDYAFITALSEDARGQLWVGTTDVGAVRLANGAFNWIGADAGATDGRAVIETHNGEIAFLGLRGRDWAVFCNSAQATRAARPRGALADLSWAWNQVLLQDSAGAYWLGTNAGVFRFSGARSCEDLDGRQPDLHLDSRTGLAADVAMRLFEDSHGDVWISTVGNGFRPDGLSRWERRTGRVQTFSDADGLPAFSRHYVSSFAEDRAGNVWIGFSRDAGLARYRDGRFEMFAKKDGVPPGQVRDLTVDGAGRLWMASFRWGITTVDDPAAAMPRFRSYTTADGLSSNEAYAIVEDGQGRIYVASARGIDRLDPKTGMVRHYTGVDGVPEVEFRAALRDRSGRLWFSSTSGVLRFDPRDEKPAPPPKVLITKVAVNGALRPVPVVGSAAVGPFSLPASQSALRVEFVALGTGAPVDYRYRYRLDDAAEWTPFSDSRSIDFASLRPGAYHLAIQARNGDGLVSESSATLAFTIVPPVWQRGWFVGAALIGLATAAYGLHRYRLARLMEITRVRDRIAADLHDDLGANLTKIAVLGEVARQHAARRETALASIAGIARESVSNMSDIVWAIDPARDSLEDVVRKMRQHASETFALGDVELRLSAPKNLSGRHAGVDFRHDLFLLFKEAVNNAARHSRCRQVEITLSLDGGAATLVVADDGDGFVAGGKTGGHGLASMRRRAARMGGRLEVTSAPGHGTRVTASFPLAATRYSFV